MMNKEKAKFTKQYLYVHMSNGRQSLIRQLGFDVTNLAGDDFKCISLNENIRHHSLPFPWSGLADNPLLVAIMVLSSYHKVIPLEWLHIHALI